MKKLIKIWQLFFLIFLLGVIVVFASVNKTLNKKTLTEFPYPTYLEASEKESFLNNSNIKS